MSDNADDGGGIDIKRGIAVLLLTIIVTMLMDAYGVRVASIYTGSGISIVYPGIVFIIIFGILIAMAGGITVRVLVLKIKSDHALSDEFSNLKLYKASYYSFIGSYYIMVIMIVLLDYIEPARFVIYIGMGLNTIIFILMNYVVNYQDYS